MLRQELRQVCDRQAEWVGKWEVHNYQLADVQILKQV